MTQQLNIKSVPSELIDKLDNLQKRSNFSNRSAFIVDILNQYCLFHDSYFINTLPDVTRILCEDAYKKGTKNVDEQLDLTLAVNKKCTQIMQELCELLGAENEE